MTSRFINSVLFWYCCQALYFSQVTSQASSSVSATTTPPTTETMTTTTTSPTTTTTPPTTTITPPTTTTVTTKTTSPTTETVTTTTAPPTTTTTPPSTSTITTTTTPPTTAIVTTTPPTTETVTTTQATTTITTSNSTTTSYSEANGTTTNIIVSETTTVTYEMANNQTTQTVLTTTTPSLTTPEIQTEIVTVIVEEDIVVTPPWTYAIVGLLAALLLATLLAYLIFWLCCYEGKELPDDEEKILNPDKYDTSYYYDTKRDMWVNASTGAMFLNRPQRKQDTTQNNKKPKRQSSDAVNSPRHSQRGIPLDIPPVLITDVDGPSQTPRTARDVVLSSKDMNLHQPNCIAYHYPGMEAQCSCGPNTAYQDVARVSQETALNDGQRRVSGRRTSSLPDIRMFMEEFHRGRMN